MCTGAHAGDTVIELHVPVEDFPRAVVDLATQASLSIGGVDPARCGRRTPALNGRMTADAAVQQLFAGSACMAVKAGPGIYRIEFVRRAPPPRPAAAPAPDVSPKEVVVTGYRRPLRLGQTPGFTSVVGASRIEGHGDDLATAALRVPGFSETNLGPGRNKILLRGFSDGVFTGHTQSSVGLYFNDTPVVYDAPDPDLLLTDIARIEVLQGPQGALYGEGSISGVVRVVSRPADPTAFSRSFAVGGALTQNGAPSYRVEGMVNLPLFNGRAGLRLVGYNDRAGGYIDDTALGKRDVNQTGRAGGRIAATLLLPDSWRANVLVMAQSIDTANSQYVSSRKAPLARAVPVAETHDNEFSETALDFGGPLAGMTAKVSLNHLHHHIGSRYDASAAAGFMTGPVVLPLIYDDMAQVELTTAEATLASSHDGRFQWLAGVYGSLSKERDDPRLGSLSGGNDLTEHRVDHVRDRAVFGEADLALTPRLTLSAGGRMAWDSHDTRSTLSEAGQETVIAARLNSSHLSHSISLVYQANPEWKLYVQSAEGYRNGGVNTTRLMSSAAIPETYRGDELNTYEAGLRWTPSGADGPQLDLSAYRGLWRNIQSDQLQASGLPVTANVGDARVSGIEGRVQWPFGPLTLFAAEQWTSPRLTRANPAYVTAEDSGLPFVSALSGDLGADWTGRAGAVPLFATADLSYASPSRLNFGPLQSLSQNGYARLDLSARAQFSTGTLELRLDNALGLRGNSFAYGNPFSLMEGPQMTPARPRTVWLTWRVMP